MGSLTGEDHGAVYSFLGDLEAGVERDIATGIGSGTVGWGGGGPVYLDNFRSKRPPTPTELVNAYKSVAFSCISLNANAVAKVPLRLYARTGPKEDRPRFWSTRRLSTRDRDTLNKRLVDNPMTRSLVSGDDDIDEITDPTHPFLASLARPNPYFDGVTLIQLLCRSLDAIGQAFWSPESIGPGFAPHALWPLHSQYVFPVKGTGGRIVDRWTYFTEEIPFEDLIWFRFVSLRDPYGSPFAPLHACFEQSNLMGYYVATVEAILKNGARPDTLIGPADDKQPWAPEQAARMEKRINQKFNGARQGGVFAVDGTFKVAPLSYSPTDLGGNILSREARLIAANCFDVPISMLETENSNKATASEGSVQHQRNAVEPRCALIAAVLTVQLAWLVSQRMFFAFDSPVQQDRKVNAEIHATYLDRNVLMPNEVRAEIGYPPTEGGDEPLDRGRPGAETDAKRDGPEPEEEDDDE